MITILEQPLPKNGACNLGSINLSEFVLNPYTKKARFDFKSFEKAVEIAIRGLDKVIDYGYKHHALEEQKDMAYNYRNIGLGIMGLGSMFFKLGIRYGSENSIEVADDIMRNMFVNAVIASNKLARELGTFPKYSDKVFDSEIMKNHFSQSEINALKKYGLRNCSLLSVAPSGSIATMLNITTGVEPAFRISYKRTTKSLHKNTDVSYDVYIKEAQEYKNTHKVQKLPLYFISSENVGYKERIDMQSIIQNHTDTAISSTVNLPKDASIKEVEDLYLLAWEKGLKGITIYRDGCKREGILTDKSSNNSEETINDGLKRGDWKQKSDDTIYYNRKINIGCGKLKLMIGWSDKEQSIQDMYVIRSGSGGCERNLQGMVIAMSGMLRLGGDIFNIEKAFEGMGSCNSFVAKRVKGEEVSKGGSCGSAILNEIKAFLKEKQQYNSNKPKVNNIKKENKLDNILNKKVDKTSQQEETDFLKENGEIAFVMKYNKCPNCGEKLQHSGGCISCQSCGFSKCE